MSTLSIEAMQELLEAMRRGDVTNGGIRRLARQPHLVSDVYVDVRELWSVPCGGSVEPLPWRDLSGVTYIEQRLAPIGGHMMDFVRYQYPPGCPIVSYEHAATAGSIKGLCFGPTNEPISWADHRIGTEGPGFLKTLSGSRLTHVQPVGSGYVTVTRTGTHDVVHDRERELARVDAVEAPAMYAYGNSVFVLLGLHQALHVTKEGNRAIRHIWSGRDAFSFLRSLKVSAIGGVLYRDYPDAKHKTALFWDAELWCPCGDPDHAYSAHGFFTNGVPHAVCEDEGRLFRVRGEDLRIGSRVIQVHAWSHDGPFLILRKEDPDISRLQYRIQWMDGKGRITEVIPIELAELSDYEAVPLADGSFIVKMRRLNEGGSHVVHLRMLHEGKIVGRDISRSSPDCDMTPYRLTASPDGRHIAWLRGGTRKQDSFSPVCLVVNGHAGRYHDSIEKIVWLPKDDTHPKTRLRYTATVESEGQKRLVCYEVTLEDPP